MKIQLKICDGNDKTLLDESLAGHKFHCPTCDVHLTSLGLCSTCGTRYELPIDAGWGEEGSVCHTCGGEHGDGWSNCTCDMDDEDSDYENEV